jgi:hypothetical protein
MQTRFFVPLLTLTKCSKRQRSLSGISLIVSVIVLWQVASGRYGTTSGWDSVLRPHSRSAMSSTLSHSAALHLISQYKNFTPPHLSNEEWTSHLEELEARLHIPGDRQHYRKAVKEYPRIIFTAHKRWDDLKLALVSLGSYPKVTVVITCAEGMPHDMEQTFTGVEWMKSNPPNRLSIAWNLAVRHHIGTELSFIICNEDVFFPTQWVRSMFQAIEYHPSASAIGLVQYYAFGGVWIPAKTFLDIGPFDDNYVMYFEDHDFIIRLNECYQGKRPVVLNEGRNGSWAIIHHRRPQSRNDADRKQLGENHALSDKIFHKKWDIMEISSSKYASQCNFTLVGHRKAQCCIHFLGKVAVRMESETSETIGKGACSVSPLCTHP